MATLLAAADGNLTSSSTWKTVDTTSLLISEASNATLTTSSVASATFTPGAITVDAVAVRVAVSSQTAHPADTITMELFDATASSIVATVTCTANDLPASAATGSGDSSGGWALFAFASITLTAGHAYSVRLKSSRAGTYSFFTNATSSNWSRLLRTTTTAAPAAGDNMVICGEITGSGAITTRTVTMDSTAATNYGSAVGSSATNTAPATAALYICKGGTLTWGVAASINYILQLSGWLIVANGGVYNMGTSGSPIPDSSTAKLQFNNAADGDYYFAGKNGSTINIFGSPRTAGKLVTQTRLSANAAANATTVTVADDTGWLSGDVIAIASTSQTIAEAELGSLSSGAGSSSLPLTGFAGAGGGLHFAHGGVDPIAAEVILLTRNVAVTSVLSTANSGILLFKSSAFTASWAEFSNLGWTNGAFGAVISVQIDTTGVFSVKYCSLHDLRNPASSVVGGLDFQQCAAGYTADIENTCFYNAPRIINTGSATPTSFTLRNVTLILSPSTFPQIDIAMNANLTLDHVSVSSHSAIAFSLGMTATAISNFSLASLWAHSGLRGINATTLNYATISDFRAWRLTNYAITFGGKDLTLSSPLIFGNGNSGTNYAVLLQGGRLFFNDGVLAGDTTFNTCAGIQTGGNNEGIFFNGGNFGAASGIYAQFGGQSDINIGANLCQCYISGALVRAGGPLLVGSANLPVDIGMHWQRMNNVSGAHLSIYPNGQIAPDFTTFHTAAPSQTLTPTTTGAVQSKFRSQVVQIAVNSGQSKTVSVWVQKNGSYAGSQPRLMQLMDPGALAGMTNNAVLATMSAGSGTWQQLIATVGPALDDTAFQFYVDCDGAAGNVFVDDWAST